MLNILWGSLSYSNLTQQTTLYFIPSSHCPPVLVVLEQWQASVRDRGAVTCRKGQEWPHLTPSCWCLSVSLHISRNGSPSGLSFRSEIPLPWIYTTAARNSSCSPLDLCVMIVSLCGWSQMCHHNFAGFLTPAHMSVI